MFDYDPQIIICHFYSHVEATTIRIRYNQVLQLTQDTTLESDKNTIKHHKQKPRGLPFPSRRPQGCIEQMRKHEKHKT